MTIKKIINLRSTDYLINPKVPPPNLRPKCKIKGCKNSIAISKTNTDGTPYYRLTKLCGTHHWKALAEKHGKSVCEFNNERHPYRKHRKTYCENRDGRFGFKCRYTIKHSGQLQVDHKNGDPHDNRPRNLQTLCANCHIYKTHLNKDYSSPGRKKLKKIA